MRGTLYFVFIDRNDDDTMTAELEAKIAKLLPVPRKEGLRAQPAVVEIEGMCLLGDGVQLLVRVTVP
jgi:hypothetical protein